FCLQKVLGANDFRLFTARLQRQKYETHWSLSTGFEDFFAAFKVPPRHWTFGGSGRPWARSAVRKCILATFARLAAPCFSMNSFAASSTAAEAPLGMLT